ncbi:MAG: hypothetical protein ACREB9_06730 [Thermoplasmata archaeon]
MRHQRSRDPSEVTLLCPQCRSAKIVFEAGLITGQVYHCQNCDYVGSLILEIDTPKPGDPLPE